MSFKHSVHRISWVPIIACIAAGLFMIALFFIVGFHVFFEKMPLFLIECGLAGLFIYFGLFLWYQRLKKQMRQHKLQKIYAFYWVYLERPRQLHD
ncbi:hypothetical protein KGI01_08650 [Kurthia gibsonii]|nr:hypothetical protein KGI01_08650 [Kurthia gibsonii]